MDYLANKNKHMRDANISFEAGPHIYTIFGEEGNTYTSVTTWNHSHFGNFDADAIITNMMKGKNWSKSKYFGQSREEIKDGWEKNRDEAAKSGTNMHYQIECYYNNVTLDEPLDSIEYSYFNNFLDVCKGLHPYRTEWMVYHEELRLAGSIDMVYENPDGSLMIYDWKRSKDIVKTKPFVTYAITECINHVPDTNFWHYALQLNTYKMILESKYGKTVTKLALVCLHPSKKNFEIIPVPVLKKEIEDLVALRKHNLVLIK